MATKDSHIICFLQPLRRSDPILIALSEVMWVGLGCAAFAVVTCLDYRKLGLVSALFYFGGIALLITVLLAGKVINNARSWLPIMGITVQPAELAKPATILFLAWLGSRPAFHLARLPDQIFFALAASLPIALIAKQPDWGTALVFVPAAAAIAFIAGLPWKTILLSVLALVLITPLAHELLLDQRQRQRIRTFLNPGEDISDAGWNAHQSLLAVGSGGVFGKGFMEGNQHVLGYLPRTVAPTDFIFSVVGEETGFVGAGAGVLAYLGILLCCLRTAANAPDRFGSYLCVGVAALLFAHVYINIGMTIRAAPIIGIPLPFLSYGGSFMLSMLTCLGLVQSVHARRHSSE
jgi:rod shape determining protein RodA